MNHNGAGCWERKEPYSIRCAPQNMTTSWEPALHAHPAPHATAPRSTKEKIRSHPPQTNVTLPHKPRPPHP